MNLTTIALKNLKRNFSFYSLYLVSVSFVLMVYFCFTSFSMNEIIMVKISSDGRVEMMCSVVAVFIMAFVVFYMFYSNNFFMRRRMKELGIYALLGYRTVDMLFLLTIENIFICLAAPFLIAAAGSKYNRKNYIIIVLGFLCCIISAYLNTFFTALYRADSSAAVIEITPVIEETVKLLPLLFCITVFDVDTFEGGNIIFNTAIGFATFENICYLLENGTDNLFHLVIRGFATGAMHITCAYVIGLGLKMFKKNSILKTAGTFGLLCVTITFHAIFNMLMKTDGTLKQLGYAMPITSAWVLFLLQISLKKFFRTN